MRTPGAVLGRGGTAEADGDELVLRTALEDVELRRLTGRDADAYYALIDGSREHLRQFGDYRELAASTRQDVVDYFADPPDRNLRMGIWRRDELLGRIDLNPVAPRTFVVGYWLGLGHTGHGYASAAGRALIEHGRRALAATDFWAGVTHGNRASVAVLERLGFSVVEDLEHHTRFHLPMA